MSDSVAYIVVDATQAPYHSIIVAVTLEGIVYPLPKIVHAGQNNVRNDVPIDTDFQIRVTANGGATTTSDKTLTGGGSKSAYFSFSGSAAEPVITFTKIE